MSKGKNFNLYDDVLQEILSAAKRLAVTLDKKDLDYDQARAVDALREHLLCPTCCNQGLNDITVNICGGTDAHVPKTNYKVGDRVQLLSISGIDQDTFKKSPVSTWPFEVTVVSADHEDATHDLLVECKEHDSVYWVDFSNVKKLSRFGWIDGYIRKGEHVVEISGVPLSPKPSQSVFNHSPDGFCWGHQGSGPTQLALALLLQYGSKQFAVKFYSTFRQDVLASVTSSQDKGFALHGQAVVAWIVAHSSDDHVKKDCQPSDKIWLLTTTDECECDKAEVNFVAPGECVCNTQVVHTHCYCGGVFDFIFDDANDLDVNLER